MSPFLPGRPCGTPFDRGFSTVHLYRPASMDYSSPSYTTAGQLRVPKRAAEAHKELLR